MRPGVERDGSACAGRDQADRITDAQRASATYAHVHPAPPRVHLMRDARDPAVEERILDVRARRRVRRHLDLDVAEGQPRAGADALPRQSGDGDVLSHRAAHDRVPLRHERIDPLLRVQTQGPFGAAVESTVPLPISLQSPLGHRRRLHSQLRHTAVGPLQAGDAALELEAHPGISWSSEPPGTTPLTILTGIPPFVVRATTCIGIWSWRSSAGSGESSVTRHPGACRRSTLPSCAQRSRTRPTSPTRTPYGGLLTIRPPPASGTRIDESAWTAKSRSAATPARSALPRALSIAPASRSLPMMGAGEAASMRAPSSARTDRPSSAGTPGQPSIAKRRRAPGGMRRARSAPSIGIVPDPHIGSTSGATPSHSEAAIRAAARVSRSGAFAVAWR